jgi:hypothetical protein
MTDENQASEPVLAPDLAEAVEGIWVAAQKAAWSSLVVVPARTGLPAAEIARALAAAGTLQRGEPVESLDLRGLPLGRSRPMVEALSDSARPFHRVVAVDCPLDSQTAVLLASSAGAAVLVVERETTSVDAARRVLELVGPARFLGAVLLAPPA